MVAVPGGESGAGWREAGPSSGSAVGLTQAKIALTNVAAKTKMERMLEKHGMVFPTNPRIVST